MPLLPTEPRGHVRVAWLLVVLYLSAIVAWGL